MERQEVGDRPEPVARRRQWRPARGGLVREPRPTALRSAAPTRIRSPIRSRKRIRRSQNTGTESRGRSSRNHTARCSPCSAAFRARPPTTARPSVTTRSYSGGTARSWTIAPFTSNTSQSQLISVSCPDLTTCFAVGSYSERHRHQDVGRTTASAGTGGSFRARTRPDRSSRCSTGVSCRSATDCTAVGSLADDTAQKHTDRALGRHHVVDRAEPDASELRLRALRRRRAPAPQTVPRSVLEFGAAGAATLIEHWDGAAWSIVPSPNPAFGRFNELADVACPSASELHRDRLLRGRYRDPKAGRAARSSSTGTARRGRWWAAPT